MEWKDVFHTIDTLTRKIKSITGVYSEVNYMKAAYLFIHKCKHLYKTCNCKTKMCEDCKIKIQEWSKPILSN